MLFHSIQYEFELLLSSLQLYTAYVETQEALELQRVENKRVNKYLDDIVQEVEAKGPVLKRQRDEHERMQKSVASLSAKLEQAVKVFFKCIYRL
jgi:nucleoprotein TPR